jgi:hypothetical protein
VVKALVNDAMHDVVNGNLWSWRIREDGEVYFPPPIESDLSLLTDDSIGDGTIAWIYKIPDWDWTTWTDRYIVPRRVKLRLPEASNSGVSLNAPDLLLPIEEVALRWIVADPLIAWLTFEYAYRGNTMSEAGVTGTVYTHEIAFPKTVASVLSVRDESSALRVEFVDRHVRFDDIVPRMDERTAESPFVVYVGGYVRPTSFVRYFGPNTVTLLEPNEHMGMMVWPPPSSDLMLKYSYVYRYEEMEDETDTLDGVPDDTARFIAAVAFQKALMGNIENDLEQGTILGAENGLRLQRMKIQDRPSSLRYNTQPFTGCHASMMGMGGHG